MKHPLHHDASSRPIAHIEHSAEDVSGFTPVYLACLYCTRDMISEMICYSAGWTLVNEPDCGILHYMARSRYI